MKTKKRKVVPCNTAEHRRSSSRQNGNGNGNGNGLCCRPKRLSCVRELEEQVCSTLKRVSCVKNSVEAVCSTPKQAACIKQEETACKNNNNNNNRKLVTCQKDRTVNCCVKTCPGKPRKPYGCPRCESNRIQKLECEVYRLRKEIENMKYERQEAETALQKAILRGAKALGGRYKPMIPGSIEKLLDSCSSETTSRSSLTVCAARNNPSPATVYPCHRPRKKEEFNYCEGCAH